MPCREGCLPFAKTATTWWRNQLLNKFSTWKKLRGWDQIQRSKRLFEKKLTVSCYGNKCCPILEYFFQQKIFSHTAFSLVLFSFISLLSLCFSVLQSQHCWGSWSNSPGRVLRTRGPSCWKPWKRFVVLSCILSDAAAPDVSMLFLFF